MRLLETHERDAVLDAPPYIDAPPEGSRSATYALALAIVPWLMAALAVGLAATAHTIDPVAAAVGWGIGLASGLAGGLWGSRMKSHRAVAATMLGLWAPYITFTPTLLAVLLTNDWPLP